MTIDEYLKIHSIGAPLPPTDENGLESPVPIKVVNNTLEDFYRAEMEFLEEGGADYNGLQQLRFLAARNKLQR